MIFKFKHIMDLFTKKEVSTPKIETYLTFHQAKRVVTMMKVQGQEDYDNLGCDVLEALKLPVYPPKEYRYKGWVNWDNFLDKDLDLMPFEEAKRIVRGLGFKNYSEWRRKHKLRRASGVVFHPEKHYKDKGWAGWTDFFSSGQKRYRCVRIEKAKEIIRACNLTSRAEFDKLDKDFLKRNKIPFYPSQSYRDCGWVSWDDFLGKE